MSEATECDRCGALFSGSADTTVSIMPGWERRRADGQPDYVDARNEPLVDLCAGCWNDLRRWWMEAGGNAEDVRHSEVADE